MKKYDLFGINRAPRDPRGWRAVVQFAAGEVPLQEVAEAFRCLRTVPAAAACAVHAVRRKQGEDLPWPAVLDRAAGLWGLVTAGLLWPACIGPDANDAVVGLPFGFREFAPCAAEAAARLRVAAMVGRDGGTLEQAAEAATGDVVVHGWQPAATCERWDSCHTSHRVADLGLAPLGGARCRRAVRVDDLPLTDREQQRVRERVLAFPWVDPVLRRWLQDGEACRYETQ